MASDPIKQSWYLVLEHSIWCVAWGAAAPLASHLAPIVDHAWLRVACGVLAYPIKLHLNLAWAMGYLGSGLEPQVQFLRSAYGNPNSVSFALLPPILNFALLALPTTMAAGVQFRLLPWISVWLRRYPSTVKPLTRPWSVTYVFVVGAGLSSLPLLWMFWITTLFIAMLSGLGNALSNPPAREHTTIIDLIARTLTLYVVVGVPVLLLPFLVMFLRRRFPSARRLLRGKRAAY